MDSGKWSKDHLGGALLVALGAAVVVAGVGDGTGTLRQMGSGFFSGGAGRADGAGGPRAAGHRAPRPLVPASFACVFIAAPGDRANSWRAAVALAAALTGLGVLVFHSGLHLMLPLFAGWRPMHDSLLQLMFGFGVALQPENLMWSVFGVLIGNLIGVLPGIGPLSTISMTLSGLLCGTVGTDAISGTPRFTLGLTELRDGVELGGLSMGLFGIADFLVSVNRTTVNPADARARMRDMRPSLAEMRQSFWPMVRQAEGVKVREMQAQLDRADPAAAARFKDFLARHNANVVALNKEVAESEAATDADNADSAAANQKCTALAYRTQDMDAVLNERKKAEAPASAGAK